MTDEEIGLERFVSLTQAAKLRGTSLQAVQDLVRKGRFRKFMIGGRVFLDKTEVERYEKSRGGRPRSGASVDIARKKPASTARRKKG